MLSLDLPGTWIVIDPSDVAALPLTLGFDGRKPISADGADLGWDVLAADLVASIKTLSPGSLYLWVDALKDWGLAMTLASLDVATGSELMGSSETPDHAAELLVSSFRNTHPDSDPAEAYVRLGESEFLLVHSVAGTVGCLEFWGWDTAESGIWRLRAEVDPVDALPFAASILRDALKNAVWVEPPNA